ncbi:hypothetical protein J6590_026854 [Homalodisca vitripennis]|nr:hypothetical protein J6590_088111 [Homalodisca vitripennis]KAG8302654.1 hypothetical protein J6590_026854 [Homalodisca vitripennis]
MLTHRGAYHYDVSDEICGSRLAAVSIYTMSSLHLRLQLRTSRSVHAFVCCYAPTIAALTSTQPATPTRNNVETSLPDIHLPNRYK